MCPTVSCEHTSPPYLKVSHVVYLLWLDHSSQAAEIPVGLEHDLVRSWFGNQSAQGKASPYSGLLAILRCPDLPPQTPQPPPDPRKELPTTWAALRSPAKSLTRRDSNGIVPLNTKQLQGLGTGWLGATKQPRGLGNPSDWVFRRVARHEGSSWTAARSSQASSPSQ